MQKKLLKLVRRLEGPKLHVCCSRPPSCFHSPPPPRQKFLHVSHGRSQYFSKGGHTLSNRGYSRFRNLNIVGCLNIKRLYKGGLTGTPGPPSSPPPPPPQLRPSIVNQTKSCFAFWELSSARIFLPPCKQPLRKLAFILDQPSNLFAYACCLPVFSPTR